MAADLARLVAEKNKQRAALKKEYYKLLTNPNAEGSGHIFDPAVQRHGSMRVTRIEFFRETPKNFLRMALFIALPLAGTVWLIKSSRDEKENAIRSGNVAYKDRLFKLQ